MAAFIMSGPLQALGFVLLFALLSLFLPFLGLLSNAAIGLVTLRLGWRRGLMLALPASVALGSITLWQQGSLFSGMMPNLLVWLLLIAMALLLTRTTSWKLIIQLVFGIAAVAVLLFHLNVADPGAFWKSAIHALVDAKDLQARLIDLNLQELFDRAASYMTGVFAAGMALGLILSMMVARHWQAMLYNPGGFQQEWRELYLNKLVGIALMVLITLSLVTGTSPMTMDLILVGLSMFLFQGIAMVHGIRVILNANPVWLFGMYVPLVIMPVQMGILLAAFGLIDSIADFRSFLARSRPKA